MGSSRIKVGRNDACPCGSGNKYKKCCLLKEKTALETQPLLSKAIIQASENRLKQRLQNEWEDGFTLHAEELDIKMSEVIVHLAESLLESAKTKAEIRKAISIVCLAWNLSVMFEREQQEEKLEEFLKSIDDVQGQQDARDIIYAIIEDKKRYYPYVQRIIIDYELLGNKNNFHLNVISTVPQASLAG